MSSRSPRSFTNTISSRERRTRSRGSATAEASFSGGEAIWSLVLAVGVVNKWWWWVEEIDRGGRWEVFLGWV